ncbi:MAG TPA: exo-alpha-sialidase [Gemmatimonadaceae bacterium]|nr:exo-alpha-sialidase [Gemmatimonadaceae bacterium]
MEGRYGKWSTPRSAIQDGDGPGVVARWPSIATIGDRAYFAGTDIAFFTDDTVGANVLRIGELGGGSIAVPSGSFRFAFPRLIADARNRLHLLWAEPVDGASPVSGVGWLRQTLSRVWTATRSSEGDWSSPRLIYEGSRLGWRNAVVGAGAGAGQSKWALSVVEHDHSGRHHAIVLFHFENGEMVASVVDSAERAVHSSVASVGTDVFLGFVSPVPRELLGPVGSDVNSVHLSVSHDGGKYWDAATLVSRSGEHAAHELRTLLAPDGTVHLVWRQSRVESGEVIRHVASSDGGRTWSQPDDLLLAPGSSGMRAVMDLRGRVHVVLEHWEAQTGEAHVDYATWRDEWSVMEHLFPSLSVTGTTLHRALDGRLLLAFLARPAGSPMDVAGYSMYSDTRVR